jgi:hypothetical protein
MWNLIKKKKIIYWQHQFKGIFRFGILKNPKKYLIKEIILKQFIEWIGKMKIVLSVVDKIIKYFTMIYVNKIMHSVYREVMLLEI